MEEDDPPVFLWRALLFPLFGLRPASVVGGARIISSSWHTSVPGGSGVGNFVGCFASFSCGEESTE